MFNSEPTKPTKQPRAIHPLVHVGFRFYEPLSGDVHTVSKIFDSLQCHKEVQTSTLNDRYFYLLGSYHTNKRDKVMPAIRFLDMLKSGMLQPLQNLLPNINMQDDTLPTWVSAHELPVKRPLSPMADVTVLELQGEIDTLKGQLNELRQAFDDLQQMYNDLMPRPF